MRCTRIVALLLALAAMPACSTGPSVRGVVSEPVKLTGADAVEIPVQVIRPAGNGPFPPVIVVHGDLGPTYGVQDNARLLADAGFLTLVVDLYRGEKVANVLEAHILDRALPEERVRGDLKAGLAYLRTRKDVRPGNVGIVGFDSGGGNALEFAMSEPAISAVVVCYGRLTTDPEMLKKLNASVLGLFAEKDLGIDATIRKSFVDAMEKAGKTVAGIHVYAGCENGFLAPSKEQKTAPPREAVDAARAKIVEYLRAELK